jgi:HAD superfamily hydrolase (TIGR01459 family)
VKVHASLSGLSREFGYFIVDVWGVLHDGFTPYPGAIKALEGLRRAGAGVVLVSNTPSTAQVLAAELAAMGFAPELYDAIATSGELTREAVTRERTPGERFLHIGPENRAGLLDGLGFTRTGDAAGADFLLVTGLNRGERDPAAYLPLLERAASRGLDLYCANPDLGVVRQDGSHRFCAGSLAGLYETSGGRALYFGKPLPAIYERALAAWPGAAKGQAACIGDGLATDVLGAVSAGLCAVLLASGVAAHQSGLTAWQPGGAGQQSGKAIQQPDGTGPAALLRYCQSQGILPDAILEVFRFGPEATP